MALHEGHRERMRRQLKTSGMDSLSDVQVLEVALYYAIPRRDTNEIAHALLSRFGSLSGVLEAPRAELLKIDGMACGMCESHINDVVRRTCSVKKVTSSHTKGETVILSEQPLDQQALRDAIAATGYTVTAVDAHPYEKKGLFSFHRK